MVKFLATENAYSNIVDIIKEASNKVVLISPYIKISDQLFDRLKHMDKQGIRIIVVCRGKDLHTEEKNKLRQLKCLELRFDEDLHAKCFYNEKAMVITSLNLYDYSQQHNREMGVLLSLDEDPDAFKEALNEAEFIVTRAKKDSVIRSVLGGVVKEAKLIGDSLTKDDINEAQFIVSSAKKDSTVRSLVKEIAKEAKSVMDSLTEDTIEKTKTSRKVKTTKRTKREGHCIRCGESIPYNEKKLYCKDCYTTSFIPTNRYAREHRCHYCGGKAETSQAKPLCTKCYALLYL